MRSKTPLTVTVLGGVAALALAGCNPNSTGGSATTASSTTTTSSAPAIANPLDTSKLQQNLCSGLTAAQVAPYAGQIKNTEVTTKTEYSGCDMLPTDIHMAPVSINLYPNMTSSAMVASGRSFPYSKNLDPIQGYPASDSSQTDPPNGECGTKVTVADHVTVEVAVQQADTSSPYYNNTCAASEALAALLVGNLKTSG